MNTPAIRTLVIKSFHIKKVFLGQNTYIDKSVLFIDKDFEKEVLIDDDKIKNINIKIIEPDNHNINVNSIMDFSPIATKVEGVLGEGITHLLTGVVVMLTGSDEDNVTCGKFGWATGVLKDIVYFNRNGTPSSKDIIINIDVTLKSGEGISRLGPAAAHCACDKIIQKIRKELKIIDPNFLDEVYEFRDTIKPGKKKVVIIKQIAGQGSMYDNQLFPNEPCGFIGGKSIIDLGNIPIILSPNEYRDGALRAMT